LQYEQEIRARASYDMTHKDRLLEKALKAAWVDEAVKGRRFITPLALEHRKRPAPHGPGTP